MPRAGCIQSSVAPTALLHGKSSQQHLHTVGHCSQTLRRMRNPYVYKDSPYPARRRQSLTVLHKFQYLGEKTKQNKKNLRTPLRALQISTERTDSQPPPKSTEI